MKTPALASASLPRIASHTAARVALGRAGGSLPTGAHLRFVGDHARARDAVWTAVDFDALAREASELGLAAVRLRSEAADRATYLRRPDLGRRLDAESREAVAKAALAPQGRIALVIADGLSAEAVRTNAVPLLRALLPLVSPHGPFGTAFLVEQGRVAIGDPIGEAVGADVVVVLVGERPGLSAADSLGVYVTWGPRVGTPDSRRNCVSNVRDGGLAIAAAAAEVASLVERMFASRTSGVSLPAPRTALPK